jgi:hypothetical protein
MPVTVELSDEALARLEAEAARRGVSVDVVINELAARLPDEGARARRQGLIGLGASTSGRTAAEADDLLAEGFGSD